MVIGIDGNEANVDNHVGTSVYTLELLKHWQTIASKDASFIVYLREKPRSSLPVQTDYFQYRIVSGKRFWRDFYFPLYLYLHKEIDVLYCPAHYTPRWCPVPIVVALHDIAYEFFPHEFLKKDLYKLKHWTQHAISQARHIICVSESTKKDAMNTYAIPESKLHVVLNGFRPLEQTPASHQEKTLSEYNLTKHGYVLYVGTLQPRKNIPTLVKAFKHIHATHPHIKLVIVGKQGWLFDSIYQSIREADISDNIVLTGYVPNDKASSLYSNAAVFVMPSLYEGFGIPLLEAMYLHCPVVSSSASCLPETGGDACLYFDPHDEFSCATAIQSVLNDSHKRQELIKAGTAHVKKFSFQKMSEETLDVIKLTLSK